MQKASFVVAAVIWASGIASIATAQQWGITSNEIVVAATKTEKELRNVTQSVTVITAEEIKRSTASNVAEALQLAAGAFVDNYGTPGSVSSVHLRGSSAGQVLVLLDGTRLNTPLTGQADLSAVPIPVEDIERIEIVRGPSSALYGPDALGGVVNIITKKPASMVSHVSGAAGSHGYDFLQFGTSSRKRSAYYSVTGTRETSDGYRQNSDLEQWIVNGRAGYDFSKVTTIDLTANYLSKENGVPGAIEAPSPYARQQDRELVLGATFRTRFSKSLDLRISGARSEDQLRYQDEFPFPGPSPVNSQHKSTSETGEAQVNWLAGSWSLFTLGFEKRKDGLSSTDAGDHQTTNDAWFLQDEVSLGRSLIVVIAGREDKHSVYGDRFSPRTSGRYVMTGSDTIIRASYGKSFRDPTFGELYWSDVFTTGNPDLKPEISREYEAGIEQPLGSGNRIKLTGFERKVWDLISYNPTVFPGTFGNLGKADVKGVEAEAVLRVSSTTQVGANYAYLKAVDQATGDKIYGPLYPKNQAKGFIDIAVDKNVHLYIGARMAEYYAQQGDPVWRYAVVDAKIAETFGRRTDRKGEIFFAMNNVFDRRYDAYRYFGSYPAAPREIRGGITIPF